MITLKQTNYMKKNLLNILILGLGLGASASTALFAQNDDIIKAGSKKGAYIIQTDKLTQSEEYHGYAKRNVPLRIYIDNGKIERVEAYDHKETPRFFAKVNKQLLPWWEGKTIKEALKKSPDAITGATFSSEAVIKSVKAGLQYAKKKGIK